VKRYECNCGARLFFDDARCGNCGRRAGFDYRALDLLTFEGGSLLDPDGRAFRYCDNYGKYDNCNWLLRQDDDGDLCLSCAMSEIIPGLGRPGNLVLWTRIERAKRRLLYSLLRLGLPISGEHRLQFRFMEDNRRNPDVYQSFVLTGTLDNTITLNLEEADDVARHTTRERMHERYRTVLGHLRHEAAHSYFKWLTARPEDLEQARALFGDERQDYQAALDNYYQQGPPRDWPQAYISAYAASHPAEDFAESFAHFLHIADALETAHAESLVSSQTAQREGAWLGRWIDLAIKLNELNRSLGADDAYPFVLMGPAMRKIELIDKLVRRKTT
jgi:hypothetical protein